MEQKVTRKEKARASLKKSYPEFNPLNYDVSMRVNLHWYNLEETEDSKKELSLLFWSKQGKDTKPLSKLDKGYFGTSGAVSHMVMSRNIDLSDAHELWMESRYKELMGFASVIVKKEEEKEVVKPTKVVVDRTPELIGELEGILDSRNYDFDMRGFIAKNEIKVVQAKRIISWFKERLKEFDNQDDIFEESYAHFGKRDLKKYIDLITKIVTVTETYFTKTKKVRVVKQKPAGVLVKGLNLIKSIPELGLLSIPAEKIVGASEIWVYDNAKRKLYRINAITGMKLTVKGKSICNFNVETSGSKTLRKPKDQLQLITTIRKNMNVQFDIVKSTLGKFSGRMNDDMILIGAF